MFPFSLSKTLRLSAVARLSLHSQLGIFLGCTLPLLWLFIAFDLQRVQDRTMTDGQKETQNIVRVFAEEVRSSVHAIDLTLVDLRDHWLDEPQNFAARIRSRQAHLEKDVAFQIAIIDFRGKLVYSSVDPQAKPVDLSDREHFRVHRDSTGDVLFISKPVLGRVSQRWSIQFTRPLIEAHGQFAGVIVLSVSPDYFTRFSQTIDLGPGGTIALARTTGELLARSPGPARALGHTLRDVPFLNAPPSEAGFFQRVSLIDGKRRLYTWRTLSKYDLVVAIGRSMDNLLDPYLRQRQTYLLSGAGISVLLALIGYILLAGLQQRARARTILEQSEFRWKYALEGADEGVWDWNNHTNEVFYSKRWKAMLGYEDHEIENRIAAWQSLLHPEDKSRILAATADYISGATQTYANEYRLLCKDNNWKWVFSRGMIVSRDTDGTPLRLIGTHADITERKRAEESMQLAFMVYENSNEGMLVTDAENIIIAVNQAFTDLTGYTSQEIIGKKPNILNSGRHDDEFHAAIWHSIKVTGRWQGEIWNRRKNGDIYAEWISINTIFNQEGVHRRVALFSDLAKKKEYEALIWEQANCDPLTGLLNRRIFHDRLEQEIRRADRKGLSIALMFLDLDHFKEVNDALGHSVGDLLIQEAALRLRSCMRESDSVARLGGDEFTVIIGELHGTDVAVRIAQEMLRKLEEPFQLGLETIFISTSIGITFYPKDGVTLEVLLKNADQAMYAAKNQGRNRVHFFTPSMQEAAQARMRLANDLRGALTGNQFRVVYQPIVDLMTGDIYKAEALIRWHHPSGELISPARFIPIAEQTGAIKDIGDWIFREAARQAKRLRTTHHPEFQISVNKSPAQFRDDNGLYKTWVRYLEELDLPGRSIAIEITEGLLLDAGTVITDKLGAFRDAGIQISLDDFGTGYSSLSYLKKFDIDYIKIDQSFVRNLAAGSDDMALCKAMIVMAHTLGLKVIAEGIETAEQRDLLIAAGCDYGQGYLFSRPVPSDELEAMLGHGRIGRSTR
jgi:diguanylate cyclase (GGDEF)-like protein/PAS domain S-box-containing protein